jgi:ArsR family transcriptional regulator
MSIIKYSHMIKAGEIAVIEIFKALSDENRMRMLHLLSIKPLCVCELEVLLEMNQSNVSRHLGKLKLAGLITPIKEGLWVHYEISASFIKECTSILSYLESRWQVEPLYRQDRNRYEIYTQKALNCKDITENRERVSQIIGGRYET